MDENLEQKLTDINQLSIQDASYPIGLFQTALQIKYQEAQSIASSIYKEILKDAPIAGQLPQAFKKGFRLVVDAGDDTLKAIERGQIKLSVEKAGKTFAQIRNADGTYGKKFPIKKEFFRKGVDPVQMVNAMQIQALQNQIEEITQELCEINHGIMILLEGQQNDRIAQYYAGLCLYTEAQRIEDIDFKKELIAQSLKLLTEATFELSLEMQSSISRLSSPKSNLKQKDEAMITIGKCFTYIHQTSLLRAAIYCNENELPAMASVLSQYSGFIENTVSKNADLLTQWDVKDDGTDSGIWKPRANLSISTNDLAHQLTNTNKTVYLSISEEI